MSKVSIIIPVYNRAHLIKRSLSSVFRQTYRGDIEIIVVNDGSLDETSSAVHAFVEGNKAENRTIQLLEQKNGGPSCARNNGLKHANGDYISYLDSDDEYSENKIETDINIFKSVPMCDVVISRWCIIKTTGLKSEYEYTDDGRHVYRFLCESGWPVGAATYKRSVVSEVGQWNECLNQYEDWDYHIRLGIKSQNVSINPDASLFIHDHDCGRMSQKLRISSDYTSYVASIMPLYHAFDSLSRDQLLRNVYKATIWNYRQFDSAANEELYSVSSKYLDKYRMLKYEVFRRVLISVGPSRVIKLWDVAMRIMRDNNFN